MAGHSSAERSHFESSDEQRGSLPFEAEVTLAGVLGTRLNRGRRTAYRRPRRGLGASTLFMQESNRGRFQVVELARARGPGKRDDCTRGEEQRNRQD